MSAVCKYKNNGFAIYLILFAVYKCREAVFATGDLYGSLDQGAGIVYEGFGDVRSVFSDPL